MWPRRRAHPWAKWTLFKKIYVFIIIITMAVLGLCPCTWAFSSYGRRGPLSSCGAWLRSAVASPAVEHRTWSTRSLVVVLGLSCPSACERFLDHGSNPCIGKQILNYSDHQGSPSGLLINGGSHGTAFGRNIKVDPPGWGGGLVVGEIGEGDQEVQGKKWRKKERIQLSFPEERKVSGNIFGSHKFQFSSI